MTESAEENARYRNVRIMFYMEAAIDVVASGCIAHVFMVHGTSFIVPLLLFMVRDLRSLLYRFLRLFGSCVYSMCSMSCAQ